MRASMAASIAPLSGSVSIPNGPAKPCAPAFDKDYPCTTAFGIAIRTREQFSDATPAAFPAPAPHALFTHVVERRLEASQAQSAPASIARCHTTDTAVAHISQRFLVVATSVAVDAALLS